MQNSPKLYLARLETKALTLFRNIFFVLPAMTVVYVLSNAIPVSDLLRLLVTRWKELTHGLITGILNWMPFLPPVSLPDIIMDELSLTLLLLGSLFSKYLVERMMKRADSTISIKGQFSRKTYWLSVLILAFLFFAVYDVQFYADLLLDGDSRASADPNILELWGHRAGRMAITTGIFSWALLAFFVILTNSSDRQILLHKDQFIQSRGIRLVSPHSLIVGGFVFLLLASHGAAVLSNSSGIAISVSILTIFLMLISIILLRIYNRNAIVITLLVAAGIVAADTVLSSLTQLYALATS